MGLKKIVRIINMVNLDKQKEDRMKKEIVNLTKELKPQEFLFLQ